jgi:dTDP-4-amino-4,6-dideoxygalactose transaminase
MTTGETLALFGGPPVRTKPFAAHPIIGPEERQEVAEVLDYGPLSGFIARAGEHFLGGPKVKKLEAAARDFFAVPHAVAMNSATSCLHASLAAVGCGPGDEVVVPAYTMSASAAAILMCNAVPVFSDIDPVFFNMTLAELAARVTPRTRAILVVHLFGHPAPIDEILKFARDRGVPVIEDCSQAPGARFHGCPAGTLGEIGIFSLNQNKTITCGEGGIAVTRDPSLALRMQLIRNHGECIAGSLSLPDTTNILGYNYRLTELDAAVAVAQFGKLVALTGHRVRLAEYLTRRLAGFPGLTLPTTLPDCSHVYFVYPIKFHAPEWGIHRDRLVQALAAEGIPFGAGYSEPLYWQPAYQRKQLFGKVSCPFRCPHYEGDARYDRGSCPVTERMYTEELMVTSLCRYPHSEADIDDIAAAVEKIWENRASLQATAAVAQQKQ